MVKLLLLVLLFTNTVLASTLVNVTKINGEAIWQELDTEILADEYIANTKHKWGKLAGWRTDDCVGQTGTRIHALNFTEYNCPDEFTVTKTDTTIARAAREALKTIEKDMAFGKSLYAKIRLLNVGKTEAVRDAMRVAFEPIRSALFDGDICSAKSKIAVVTVDANITAENISYVLGLINDGGYACI